jgi:hypothetical protein
MTEEPVAVSYADVARVLEEIPGFSKNNLEELISLIEKEQVNNVFHKRTVFLLLQRSLAMQNYNAFVMAFATEKEKELQEKKE